MRRNFRRRKFNRKRKSTYKIFFLILVGMTVGFAAINTTLQLIGTLNISRTTWNIHWENPTKTGGVTATQDVHLKNNDNTTVEYQVKLDNPGDYYEFTVDAKNEGTIDGMITGISNKVYENNVEVTKPDYLDFTVTYADDKVIANNHLLAAGKSESYKVKVSYKSGLAADQLPTTTRNLKFTFNVSYMQADDNAEPAHLVLDIGDYFYLVPDLENYTIPVEITGDYNDQTINIAGTSDDNGLRLWRIIDKKQDGTIDAVSEYVTPDDVGFGKTVGYQRYIDTMQIIASKFGKEGYTVKTRMIGYDGQTLIIPDHPESCLETECQTTTTYAFDGSTSTPPTETSTPTPTTGTGEEYLGGVGGDTLYLKDIQLVGNVYKANPNVYGETGLVACKPNEEPEPGKYGEPQCESYLLASREFTGYNHYNAHCIGSSGYVSSGLQFRFWHTYENKWYDNGNRFPVRPIITINSNHEIISGRGTKNNPYRFE